MKRAALFFGLVVCVGIAWLATGPTRRTEPGEAAEHSRNETSELQPSETSAIEPTTTPATLEAPTGSRTSLPRTTTRLTCSSGLRVTGVTASWTPMSPEFFGAWVGWPTQDWRAIRGSTVESTDQDGYLRVPTDHIAAGDSPLALWITHPEHAPELRLLPSGTLELPDAIELTHATPIEVRAVSSGGSPVAGARIEQCAAVPNDAGADVFEPAAGRILERSFVTAEDGTVRIAAWTGSMVLRASAEGARSEAWIGEPRDEIELVLHPTFEVRGTVVYPDGRLEGPQRVTCSAVYGAQSQPMAVLSVDSGSFGPINLPCLPAETIAFRLEGWNAEVREQRLPVPAPGTSVDLRFEARAGHDVWLATEDEHQQSIPFSRVSVSWEQEGATVSVDGHADETGAALVRGVPSTVASFTARADGHGAGHLGPMTVPSDPPVTHVVVLRPGREIRGTVTRLGEPVEDFTVVAWTYGPGSRNSFAFRERRDGSFSIRMPLERSAHLVATAPGFGASEPVQSDPQSLAAIELEVSDLVRGSGSVVDAADRSPISTATVQAHFATEFGPVSPSGPLLKASSAGRFAGLGFPVGRSMIRVSAPGYAVHWEDIIAAPGSELNLGAIALRRPGELTIRLVSNEPFDATEYYVSAVGAMPIPLQSFDANGRVLAEGVSPGLYHLRIKGPRELGVWTRLEPDEEWSVEVRVGGGRTLVVSVDPGDFAVGELSLEVESVAPSGETASFVSGVPESRRVEFEGLAAGKYVVHLNHEAGRLLGSASGTFLEEASQQVIVRPDGDRRTLVVTDGNGEPVPAATVGIWNEETGVAAWYTLDESGRAAVLGIDDRGTYRAFVRHPDLGVDPEIPIELPFARSQPIEVVFAPDLEVDVALVDDGEPVPAVHCNLFGGNGAKSVSATTSDEVGRARWERLGEGTYLLRVSGPSIWPLEGEVDAAPPGSLTEVQVRRLGGLALQVSSLSGRSSAGLDVSIDSLEFGQPVSVWLAQGRVQASSPQLRTDSRGALTIDGLPRGPFGVVVDGVPSTVEVLPGATTRHSVAVP